MRQRSGPTHPGDMPHWPIPGHIISAYLLRHFVPFDCSLVVAVHTDLPYAWSCDLEMPSYGSISLRISSIIEFGWRLGQQLTIVLIPQYD